MSIQSSVVAAFKKQVAGVNAKALTSALERKDINAALTAIGVPKIEANIAEHVVPEAINVFAESGRKENLAKDKHGVCSLPTARNKVLPAFGEREKLKKAKDRLTSALAAHRTAEKDFADGLISESTLKHLKSEVFNAQIKYDQTVNEIEAARRARKGVAPKTPTPEPAPKPSGPPEYGVGSGYMRGLAAELKKVSNSFDIDARRAIEHRMEFERSPAFTDLVKLTNDVTSTRALAEYVREVQLLPGTYSMWNPRLVGGLTDLVRNVPKEIETLRAVIGQPDYRIGRLVFNPNIHTSTHSNALGSYWLNSRHIEIAIGNFEINRVQRYEANAFYQRWCVGKGTKNVFLHEAGHHYHLSGRGMNYAMNFEWQEIFKQLGADYFKRKTSTYAGTDFMEAFTETLSMYILEPDVFEGVHDRQIIEFFRRLKIKKVNP